MDFPKVNTAVFHPICSSVMWSGDSPQKRWSPVHLPLSLGWSWWLVWPVEYVASEDILGLLRWGHKKHHSFCLGLLDHSFLKKLSEEPKPCTEVMCGWQPKWSFQSTADISCQPCEWGSLGCPALSSLQMTTASARDQLQKFWASCSKSIKSFKQQQQGLN